MNYITTNVYIASQYGYSCAILLQYIQYWTDFNQKNDKNYYDGRYWMYNNSSEFLSELPFLKPGQIRSALETLRKEGFVEVGHYGRGGDRTLWYTISAKGKQLLSQQYDESNEQVSTDDENFKTPIEEAKTICNQEQTICNQEQTICSQEQTICSQLQMVYKNNNTKEKEKEKEIYKEKEREKYCHSDSECLSIFDFWNASDLLKCSELTPKLKYIINCALKRYTSDQIKEYIRRYNVVLKDKTYYFSYLWSLKGFLTSQNGICDFADAGEKWLAYNKQLEKPTDPAPSSFIHNNYTKDQLNDFLTDLDSVQI